MAELVVHLEQYSTSTMAEPDYSSKTSAVLQGAAGTTQRQFDWHSNEFTRDDGVRKLLGKLLMIAPGHLSNQITGIQQVEVMVLAKTTIHHCCPR